MPFAELQRNFAPLRKDQEPTLEIGRIWGRKIGVWLGWPELLEHRRVVLLAEASSGKSAEFRNQADILSATGQAAFFITIEELADHGFEAALEPASAQTFEQWRGGTRDAWFFLDSVDEARLNRKSFETALKRFARALSPATDRARIFISCRVSDWKGSEDRGFIERLLPAWERPKEPAPGSNALLDPIFRGRERSRTRPIAEPERKPNEMSVVQLLPLDLDQCRTLAIHLSVQNADEFISGIRQNGLAAFAERPGDVIDLADYWKSYGRFGSFAQMVEHGINRKISERDNYRPDNDTLSIQKAREGAERLAAALSLGKSFTLHAPGHEIDVSSAGALDPVAVLDDWTEAERNALLRRGVFAPATYGRIRFHHRSTQEYLTARWLDVLLRGRGPRQAIWDLVFADRYGISTIVPSLRPAAAWLALWHTDFQDEIISREPLTLIRHGDPGSLPIEARARMLSAYASKQSQADISDDSLDNRAIWMFADVRLAEAIRAAWMSNPDGDFRFDLLRFIREGAIAACADLARGIALDPGARGIHRVVALQALAACKDETGLSAATQELVNNAADLEPRLSVEAARVLYPDRLTLAQLFTLIEQVRPPGRYSAEGFGYAITDLFDATPAAAGRCEFIERLSSLCLTQPFVEHYQRISRRYIELAKHVEPIARRELQALEDREPPKHLVQLLMAVERAERDYDSDEEGPSLPELVHSKPKVQRALAWADVAEHRAHGGRGHAPTYFWQVITFGSKLWRLGEGDLPWLFEDLAGRPTEADQRMALNAIIAILEQSYRLDAELPGLRALIKKHVHLEDELESALAPPPPPSAEMRRDEQLFAERQRQEAEREQRDRASWTRFEQNLRQNPNQLRDLKKLASWTTGARRLWGLTRWLTRRTEANDQATAPAQWRLLEEGFGREVAEAYRDGLKIFWRITKPERPKRREGGAITFKYANVLAFGAVRVEAAEDPDWTSRLTDDEAERAALHGCLTEQGYPEWIDSLIASHPHIVLSVIRRAVRREYLSSATGLSTFVYRYGRETLPPIHPAIQKLLFDLISWSEPGDINKFDCMVGMAERIALTTKQRNKLLRIAEKRLSAHRAAGRTAEARWSLAILLVLDFNRGLAHLETWLTDVLPAQAKRHAEETFAFLFDRHNPTIPSALHNASVADLERLLRLVYGHIRPEADAYHAEGSFSPDTRDHAETARSSILSALLDRPGPDAYQALRRVADDPAVSLRAARFRELARGMAERDAELLAWTPREVLSFERERTAPVKTGADLLLLVEAVLKDIQFQFAQGDASSRRILQRAEDEDEVQNWLVEQSNLRSRDRFRAFREAEVAQGDKPDVIVTSTSASCEVAIEVKHSKRWTVRQLDSALRNQLAEDYLKPEARRHGILVITHHRARQWRDTDTNEHMTFPRLIARLSTTATTLTRNSVGAIEVKCIGIDSTDPPLGPSK